MKKINFKEFEIFADIGKKKKIKHDAREEFANVMYTNCNGIAAHALSLKIYQSEGEIELNEQEEQLIIAVTREKGTPAFIDAILEQFKTEAK